MKQRTTKLLSTLLVLCMVLSLLPGTALADDSDFTIEHGLLNEYSLLTKYNGSGGDVTIPSGVTIIGSDAFRGCSNLASVTIPDGVTIIEREAFSSCSGLTGVTVPDSVTSIVADAFAGTPWLESLGEFAVVNGILLAYRGDGGAVVIPNTVTTIGDYVFEECSNLTSVTIPDGVTTIGEGAFSGCSNLTSVAIPDGVTTIGKAAFADCSMTSVTIPGSVTTMGNFAFSGCNSLTSVTVSDGATIGATAFADCSNLTSVTIPDSVTGIGAGAFDGTPWLESLGEFAVGNGFLLAYRGNGGAVVIPNGVTTIGDYVFQYCDNLTSVTIPDSVTTIGEWAFEGCGNLTGVTVPDSVTTIGEGAFSGCGNLTSATIPNSVTNIGAGAFEGTPWQKSLGKFAVVNGILLEYQGDGGAVVIPDTVTAIGALAFVNCSNLTSVTIPDGVTTIGDYAFGECNMTSVTIPDSVTSIGGYAFYRCLRLTDVYYGGSGSRWNQIDVDPTPGPLSSYGNGNAWLLNASIHYNSTGPDTPDTPDTPPAPSFKIELSAQNLTVDTKENVACEKYNIDGNNYFKLRDLAELLNGTGSQFEVGYDDASKTISITTGKSYTHVGGELEIRGDMSSKAEVSAQALQIDGVKYDSLKVYNIGGNNFFQLRQLGEVLGFEVGYDPAGTGTAIVRSR